MQLTRLSTLALLALAGVAFQAATAAPMHQPNPTSSASGAPADSGAPAVPVTPVAPLTAMEMAVQQRERTTQRGREMEAQQGTVAPVATPFTQVDGICPVCQNEAQEEEAVFVPDCGHFMHEECLKQQPTNQRRKCPVCRAVRTRGSVDKQGESLHFVPAEEGGLPAVTKRFADFLNKIAASPKDVCDNDPSPTDGWSCFRDDKEIYVTEVVLDKVVASITDATHSGCASKKTTAALGAPAADGQQTAPATDDQETAPVADLFTTISLPGGAGWGRINVQVQCIDQTSPQGLVELEKYPEVESSPVAPIVSDPEEENRLARIQQEIAVEAAEAARIRRAAEFARYFADWTSSAKTLLDNPSLGTIATNDGVTGARPSIIYVREAAFSEYWQRINEFLPDAEYQVSKYEGVRRSSRMGLEPLQDKRITITRTADQKTAFLVFKIAHLHPSI